MPSILEQLARHVKGNAKDKRLKLLKAVRSIQRSVHSTEVLGDIHQDREARLSLWYNLNRGDARELANALWNAATEEERLVVKAHEARVRRSYLRAMNRVQRSTSYADITIWTYVPASPILPLVGGRR